LEAGLGEKKVVISDVDVSAQGFREELYEAFPKLKDAGGFMFAKCKSNSRCLEPLSSLCLTWSCTMSLLVLPTKDRQQENFVSCDWRPVMY